MLNRHQRRAEAATATPNTPQLAPGIVLPPETEVKIDPIPSYYAGAIQIAQANNDFSLQFQRFIIGTAVLNGVQQAVARVTGVAEIVVSPETMKDLALSVTEAVAMYEAEFGTIQTTFSRKKVSEAQT